MARAALACILLCVASWCALTSAGHAQPSSSRAQASVHFDRALELVQSGQYGSAVDEFEQAYRLSGDDAVLYNLGMAYVAAGRPVEAASALDRYLQAERSALPPIERARIEAELQAQRARIGYLVLALEPHCARVEVDGRELAPEAASEPIPLPPGEHVVEVAHLGHRGERRALTVVAQQRNELRVQLAPLTPGAAAEIAQLPIRCAVPDVTVVLDGSVVDQHAGRAPVLATAGAHTLRFTRAGYVDGVVAVELAPGLAAAVECGVRPLPKLPATQAARLRVRSPGPSGATASDVRARVDGTALPADGWIPSGRHHVALAAPGFEPWSQEVVLMPGETRMLDARLTPLAAVSNERAAGARTQRTVAYALGGAGLAAGAAAVAFALISRDRFDDWEREHAAQQRILEQADGALEPQAMAMLAERGAHNDERLKSVWQLDALAWALAIGGGALLAGGGLLLWQASDRATPSARVGVRGQGLELRARF